MKIALVAAVTCLVASSIAACTSSGTDVTAAGPAPTATVTVAPTATRTVTAHPVIRKVVATRIRTRTVTYTPPPPRAYGNGTYIVGDDIKPGLYRAASGSSYCAWFRKSKVGSGISDDIIDWGNSSGGPLIAQIEPGDKEFLVQGDCTFRRVS